MPKMRQSLGFTAVSVVVALVAAATIAATSVYVWKNQDKDSQSSSQTTSKQPVKSAAGQQKPDPYEGWKEYKNQTYGVSFKYPSKWSVSEVASLEATGINPTEFSVNIKGNTREKYGETAVLSIHPVSLASTTAFYHKYLQTSTSTVDEKSDVLKGKNSVQLSVMNGGIPSKIYLFAVKDKTYSFESINEEINQQRSGDYWKNFDKLFQSLAIQ